MSMTHFYIFPFIAFLLSNPVKGFSADDSTQCSHLVGSCDYYRCIEETKISCGEEGYLLGFGGYYCDKFSGMDFSDWKNRLREKIFPANANDWRDEVRECLQVEMEIYFNNNEQMTCGELKDFAFEQ